MKIVHFLSSGNIGGIETLCSDYALFSQNENVFIFFWKGGYCADKISEHGNKVFVLNASKKHPLRLWRRILSILMEEKPNALLIHHADIYIHTYAMLLKQRMKSIYIVTYAHGNAEDMCHVSKRNRMFYKRWVLKKSLNKADRVVAISKSVKRSLIDCFDLPSEHISVIYNGVNTERFIYSERNFISSSYVKIIYVGRLIKEKGVQITLNALALLPDDLKYTFTIVGNGTYKSELEQLSKSLGISDKVTFVGEQRDVLKHLTEADIFIHMPVWEEGFGITIIEAMAAGLICVCADSGAIPEIIIDGENGYIVPKNDSKKLVNKIKEIVDKKNVQDISRNAHRRASDFSIEQFATRLDNLMEMTVVVSEKDEKAI